MPPTLRGMAAAGVVGTWLDEEGYIVDMEGWQKEQGGLVVMKRIALNEVVLLSEF